MKKNEATYLPLWLPLNAWLGYLEMRRQIHKPMTEYAKQLAINKLAELLAQGHSPTAVLEQSIFNSWQGLFPIHNGRSHDGTLGRGEREAAATRAEAIRRMGQEAKRR